MGQSINNDAVNGDFLTISLPLMLLTLNGVYVLSCLLDKSTCSEIVIYGWPLGVSGAALLLHSILQFSENVNKRMLFVMTVSRFSLETNNRNLRIQLLNTVSNCTNFVMLTTGAKSERKQLDNSFCKNLSTKFTMKWSRD